MKTIEKKFKTDRKIQLGYLTAFLLLVLSYLLTLYVNRQLQQQLKWVSKSNSVIMSLENLISEVKDAETGFRGYFIMKDTLFLQPFYRSKETSDSIYRSLVKNTDKDAKTVYYLGEIEKYKALRYKNFDLFREYFDSVGIRMDGMAREGAYRGKDMMDHLRVSISNLQNYEREKLNNRNEDLRSKQMTLNIIIVTSLVIAILLVLFGFITFRTENIEKKEAIERVKLYQEELQKRVEDLDKANKELLRMRSLEKFTSTGRIARTLAHEVRNPLTNIRLASEQLDMLAKDVEDSPLYLEIIKRNTTRINDLISQLLSSTKFSELKNSKESVNALLDEALALAEDRLELRHISVKKNYAANICSVLVDKEKIVIAFLNIIVNAIEAMRNNTGILSLTTGVENDKCVVKIADNGAGMDEETLSKLFEPYFTSKEKGTGLGLTNTQNIILSHKGNIEVESTVGKGTTFIITLDLA